MNEDFIKAELKNIFGAVADTVVPALIYSITPNENNRTEYLDALAAISLILMNMFVRADADIIEETAMFLGRKGVGSA